MGSCFFVGAVLCTWIGHLLVTIDRKVRSSNGRPSLGFHAESVRTIRSYIAHAPSRGKTIKNAAVLFSHLIAVFRRKGESPPNAQGAGRKRPETAPPGATTRKKRATPQIPRTTRAPRSGGHTGERGGSARVIEARLDALRADDDARYCS